VVVAFGHSLPFMFFFYSLALPTPILAPPHSKRVPSKRVLLRKPPCCCDRTLRKSWG
jgi:hypothetical protein